MDKESNWTWRDAALLRWSALKAHIRAVRTAVARWVGGEFVRNLELNGQASVLAYQSSRAEAHELRAALARIDPRVRAAGGHCEALLVGLTRYPGGTTRADALTYSAVEAPHLGLRLEVDEGGYKLTVEKR